ncbi:MAG: TIGR00645 family protein [Alphaproteobacteria bacterium]|nr:TIGR00645 family protein [Alphaproteobacteria bacterium]
MLEKTLEKLIFLSRWLLAPLYVGLVAALLFLAVKFVQQFIETVPHALGASESEAILIVLTLIDIVLVANLLLMVIFSGYENFVSKIDVGDHPDRPSWMGRLDMSKLKLRLIGSIVAISAIEVLKAFMNVARVSDRDLAWLVGIHVMFVVSGVLLALMDRIAPTAEHD